MESYEADAVVIGGGVVGLAVARALVREGLGVIVVERNGRTGEETSSRNSEVIHAGIYYRTGSLKAQLCREGRDRLYNFCRDWRVPHRQCGKWIVAVEPEQVPALERLKTNAAANDVQLEWLASARHREEPALRAEAVLSSPLTGIIDAHAYIQALVADIEAGGGWVVCHTPVEQLVSEDRHHRLVLGGDAPCELRTPRVVNAAGLAAIPLAQRWEGMPASEIPRAYWSKGHYFAYSGRHPFSRLIYPLPDATGLGVHLTLDMAGQARFGPDAHWVETGDLTVPASLRERFAEAVRPWWPGLDPDRLVPAYAGIRPRIHGPDDAPADFVIQGSERHGLPGAVNLFGIESPGLTASLAIAERVRERLA
ncbi:L-2-hydroxyglutarate oxidase LhgO [Halospina denitrificans]|uniref:L-2-hydroxyglutarate oxidase LhgO n=1 Tax=Halospina denitrificans TaxID=332522 RepID=A0A4R7JZ96_9GAMM|nr:NAD(P)/FAD-dependent oxidoreductase [Halospina denitrificans]TDT43284.1 L-2-hydroxyglutarate oxidase LhgO [Halospina denitrificans]